MENVKKSLIFPKVTQNVLVIYFVVITIYYDNLYKLVKMTLKPK